MPIFALFGGNPGIVQAGFSESSFLTPQQTSIGDFIIEFDTI